MDEDAIMGARPDQMRIALLSEAYFPETSGVTIAVYNHALFLARQGHEVLLLHPSYPIKDISGLLPTAEAPALPSGVNRREFPSQPIVPNRPESRVVSLRGARLIDQWLREQRPELVVYHNAERFVPLLVVPGWPKRLAGRRAAIDMGAKFVALAHTLVPLYAERAHEWWIRSRAMVAYSRWQFARVLDKNFTEVFTCSGPSAEQIREFGVTVPVRHGNFNGVDLGVFAMPESPPSGLVFCVLGRLAPEKNSHLLPIFIRALRSLRPDASFRIVGDGPMRPEFEALLSGQSGITITGFLPPREVARQLGDAMVYWSASDTENWSLAAREAMACGLPLVVPAALGFRDLAGLDVGFTYPPEWLNPPGMTTLARAFVDRMGDLPRWRANLRKLRPELSWDHSLSVFYADVGEVTGLREIVRRSHARAE